MPTTWKLRSILAASAVSLGFALLAGTPAAEARPQYVKEFILKYPDLKPEITKVKNCGVCHGGENGADKMVRNNYGESLMKLLGEINVKDAATIKTAMDKAADEKSATDGKSFGELIKEGKLPGESTAE
ncbi:MAG: hypothetical protein WD066_00010 [Planctomycetaceae bacterium]